VTCAAHCCAIDAQFDRRVAQRDLESYRRKGPSPSTRQLVSTIWQAGIADAHLLDVGGGVGAIAHELLAAGAGRATIVDGSAAYLAAARDEAERRQCSERLKVLTGDYTELAHDVDIADVVTLDKVVCCYPDMERLLEASASHAARLLGIVYPRDAWWVRLVSKAINATFALRRIAFRTYIFSNTAIDNTIRRAGFTPRYQRRGYPWIVALYERSSATE